MDDSDISRSLTLLRQEHRELDQQIAELTFSATPDQLQLARMKKRKLLLKDEIAALLDQLVPDIPA